MNVGNLSKINVLVRLDVASPENQLVEMEGPILREDLKVPPPERTGRQGKAQSCRSGLRNGRYENSEGEGGKNKKCCEQSH